LSLIVAPEHHSSIVTCIMQVNSRGMALANSTRRR
jgi:hypothetical protein